eukprot:TRINITY_DN2136_c0_g1_i1.p1 TRINITY_DN2136_c0_g1~~TRINITY_DN2136_c0_g1_i1.p1  ORF type:complete len:358 (+),score=91.88 TRINITY_DN2136_c0_g1_i1:808-1881(+)
MQFWTTIGFIELKHGMLKAEHKGQLMQYLSTLCSKSNFYRTLAFGMLTNGKEAFLIKYDHKQKENPFQRTREYSWTNKQDWPHLLFLFRGSKEDLGVKEPPGFCQGTSVQGFLGSGSQGQVWEVEKDGKSYAVKSSDIEGGITSENNVLKELQDIDGVVKMHNDKGKGEHLWMDKGDAVTAVEFDFEYLVDTLKSVHEYGYVHRDIRASNIIIDDDGNCRLIDFGTAEKMTQETSVFEGSATTSSDKVLQAMIDEENVNYQAEDDLIQLIRTGILLHWGESYPIRLWVGRIREAEGRQQRSRIVKKMWGNIKCWLPWMDAMEQLAQENQVDELKKKWMEIVEGGLEDIDIGSSNGVQ